MHIDLIIPSNRKKATLLNQNIVKSLHRVFFIHRYDSAIQNTSRSVSIKGTFSASQARNKGVTQSKAQLIAFTDDDCQPKNNWISEIKKLFARHSDIDLMFGRTVAPEVKQPNSYTPCTFSKNKSSYLPNTIVRHWEQVGFSNNMAVKRKVFDEIGGFKWWLGPGSIGSNGEDAEFIVRATIAGYRKYYAHQAVVTHNKMIQKKSHHQKMQELSYVCGSLAAYGFYTFQGVKECQSIFYDEIRQSVSLAAAYLRASIRSKPLDFFYAVLTIGYLLRGILIAFTFATMIPIPAKENVVKKYYFKK